MNRIIIATIREAEGSEKTASTAKSADTCLKSVGDPIIIITKTIITAIIIETTIIGG